MIDPSRPNSRPLAHSGAFRLSRAAALLGLALVVQACGSAAPSSEPSSRTTTELRSSAGLLTPLKSDTCQGHPCPADSGTERVKGPRSLARGQGAGSPLPEKYTTSRTRPSPASPATAGPDTIATASASPAATAWADTITASPGFRQRQADFLERCLQAAGPGGGNLYAQLCQLATGTGPLNEAAIRSSLDKINAREDTADFGLAAILRMLALYGNSPLISPQLHQEMVDAVLNFKYWLDEPGPDMMCWWSENHQNLFHSAELVAGQLFPDAVFTNSGMTGLQHVEHALPMVNQWLDRRGSFGFSEWHSNVYFNEDMPALLNLVDFAWDQSVATRAAMTMDIITFDFASTYFKGLFATAHGRTYPDHLIDGEDDSTSEAALVLLGLGTPRDPGNFTASFLATSPRYWPSDLLELVANDASSRLEHRQRDGMNIEDGPANGITYTEPDDMVFWWGMGAYATPQTIDGTLQAVEYYDLWDNFFWSDLAFLEPYVDSVIYTPITRFLNDVATGSALESMSAYVWRTPDYQLSGAQDYNPGFWGAQQSMWQATFDRDALVFTTAPGGTTGDYTATDWTGGWLPRATFHQNVGVIQYHRRVHPVGEEVLFVDLTHAWFPQWAFDEVRQRDGWTFGRKGNGYIALYSQQPTRWSDEAPDSELVADGRENIWVVEMGSAAENGNFDAFEAAFTAASVSIEHGDVSYQSPSQGRVEVGWTGPMKVAGLPVDLGPYERFDNDYCLQKFGSRTTQITFDSRQLVLDYDTPLRAVYNN